MTEEEKQQLRDLKVRASADLVKAIGEYGSLMSDTDPRIGEYIQAVAADPEGHNLYEILGALRYFHIRERHP